MMGRQYLKKCILLCGESDGNKYKRLFTITKRISTEPLSVCYEAIYRNNEKGILKEFYPQDKFCLKRDKNSQLIYTEESEEPREAFLKVKREYIEPYEMLLKAKKDGTDQELAAFIPEFGIYDGCDKDGNIIGSAYIWIPDSKLETFSHICDDIHKNPKKEPEYKLVLVLCALESLSRCICALHNLEMLHRDIRPSNFGVVKRGGETLSQTVSMVDFGSVCSAANVSDEIIGTEGYLEPEAGYKQANKQTDIYSIGAALFHAIIVTENMRGKRYLYSEECYHDIGKLVESSKLIQASESNSHPRLCNMLSVILQKCLSKREERYADCEELLKDLEIALYYALPSKVARKKHAGEHWVLEDAKKIIDMNGEKNSALAIQHHLYTNPLYRRNAKEDLLNVMVVGFGNYGQKFLDICLQTGQMYGKKLNVTVVSGDQTDKILYLEARPELSNFFNVDGSLKDDPENYGTVTFDTAALTRDNKQDNVDILQNIICDCYGEGDGLKNESQYIFIALGEDQLNLNAARACIDAAEVLELNCCVNFAWEGARVSEKFEGDLYPVYVCENVNISLLYSEIERMAFNAHLVWEKNLNVEYYKVKADFRKQYNHDACVANVLSLKYKLYSIGIDLDVCTFEEAAKRFASSALGDDKISREIKNQLIYTEHRRWVAEKVCAGWRCIHDLETCAEGVTKDEKNKRHVCIVRSRADQKLAMEFKINGRFEKWDKATAAELSKLDDLDRMSVELHRMYARRARIAKKHNLLSGNIMDGIRVLIEGNKKAVVAFQEWFACLKDIWYGDGIKARLYKGLKNAFLKTVEFLPMENQKSVKEQVKAFESLYYPVLASMEFRDYKQDDVALIENIPFILTYSEDLYMVIPYAVGSNSDIFGNMAAAIVANPAKILYLFCLEKEQELIELKETIAYIAEFMHKKQLRAAVELVIAYTSSAANFVTAEIELEFKQLSVGKIRQVKVIYSENFNELPELISEYLIQRRKKKKNFVLERNNTKTSYLLMGSDFYDRFDHYQFDSFSMNFHSTVGCEILKHIKKVPYISVTDMAAFRLSSSESCNQPEFYADYKELWTKYRENTSVWKQLCDALGTFAQDNDTIVSFKKKNRRDKHTDYQEIRYIIPFICHLASRKVIAFLIKHEVAEPGSRVTVYTTDSCEIIIKDRCGYKKGYDKLFSNVYALMQPSAIGICFNTRSHDINITFNNLIVEEFHIGSNRAAELTALMESFHDIGYVINLQNNRGVMNFTYATPQIKELMTTAGKMLEVYTYHKIKELGRFDDVVSSFEIDWENTEIKSEFDFILTKGFRTLFVECKARSDIGQEFYYKLSSLAQQFGINATAVLIADTEERSYYDNAPVNCMQRKRGNMMNIVTVWKSDEISNIGHTLLKIINGTYVIQD